MLKARPWRRPMVARDHAEQHRQASWLELLFDLSFVVAVAQAAVALEHSVASGHAADGLIGYLVVFAAIWWAWMSFTWFANVFDTDDVPYRLLMIVMIAGSLGLAAGVPQIAHLDFRIGVSSYVVMRLAYVAQWWRALRSSGPEWQPVARKIIALTTISQIGWVLFLWVPVDWKLVAFSLWFAADLATPLLAGWDARMGGHRHHIVERYGLFTIIVLGESIAAATTAIARAIEAQVQALPLLTLALGGLITVCSIWWIYFDYSSGRAPTLARRTQYIWGYGHYFVFAAVAAVGAGLALAVGWLSEPTQIRAPEWGVAMLACGAIAVFLVSVAVIETAEGAYSAPHALLKVVGAGLAVAAGFAAPRISVPGSILAAGLMLAGMVAYGVIWQNRLHVAATRHAPASAAARTGAAAVDIEHARSDARS